MKKLFLLVGVLVSLVAAHVVVKRYPILGAIVVSGIQNPVSFGHEVSSVFVTACDGF